MHGCLLDLFAVTVCAGHDDQAVGGLIPLSPTGNSRMREELGCNNAGAFTLAYSDKNPDLWTVAASPRCSKHD